MGEVIEFKAAPRDGSSGPAGVRAGASGPGEGGGPPPDSEVAAAAGRMRRAVDLLRCELIAVQRAMAAIEAAAHGCDRLGRSVSENKGRE